MPEAQKLAGCKSQKANKPCRMCHVEQGPQLGDCDFDAKLHVRTVWDMEADRKRVSNGTSSHLEDGGLSKTPTPLESTELAFDVTTQIPPEPLHAELLGMTLLFLSLFFASVIKSAQIQLNSAMYTLQHSTP